MKAKYVYVIEKANDGSYSAYVPDLPGCTTSGDTADDVKSSIKDAVATYIDSLREHNEPVPPPTSQTGHVEAA
jgi:predicted RNase H-like HicB family nuclease